MSLRERSTLRNLRRARCNALALFLSSGVLVACSDSGGTHAEKMALPGADAAGGNVAVVDEPEGGGSRSEDSSEAPPTAPAAGGTGADPGTGSGGYPAVSVGTGGTVNLGGACGDDLDGGADLFRVTPYLQNSTGTSITVMSLSTEEVVGRVEVFRKGGECLGSVEMEVVEIPESDGTFRNAGRISGLSPASEYDYRVVLTDLYGGVTATEKSTFRTLDPSGTHGRFVVLNDIHENWEVSGIQAAYATDFEPDLFFYNGDQMNDPGSARHALRIWQNYVTAGEHHRYTMDFIMGNHEWRGAWRQQLSYLMDSQFLDYRAPEFEGQYHRAFTHASTRFIVLDGGEDWSKLAEEFLTMRERQAAWLRDELTSREYREARFRILLMHMPLWGGEQGHQFQPFFQEAVQNANPPFDLAIFAHTHTARFMEAAEEHPFPIFIGGGKEVGTSTNIQVVIDDGGIGVEMRDGENSVLESLSIANP